MGYDVKVWSGLSSFRKFWGESSSLSLPAFRVTTIRSLVGPSDASERATPASAPSSSLLAWPHDATGPGWVGLAQPPSGSFTESHRLPRGPCAVPG